MRKTWYGVVFELKGEIYTAIRLGEMPEYAGNKLGFFSGEFEEVDRKVVKLESSLKEAIQKERGANKREVRERIKRARRFLYKIRLYA